jgi:hypothetical protein
MPTSSIYSTYDSALNSRSTYFQYGAKIDGGPSACHTATVCSSTSIGAPSGNRWPRTSIVANPGYSGLIRRPRGA